MKQSMTYAGAGVDYKGADGFKRAMQTAANSTSSNMRFGFRFLDWTRGESVQLFKTPIGHFGLVLEGLGTKNAAADAMYERSLRQGQHDPPTRYDDIGRCNCSAVYNDLITLGALPLVYSQYAAAGDSKWFANGKRNADLAQGTEYASDEALAVWGGGESPILVGMVCEQAIELAGAGIGFIPIRREPFNPAGLKAGDAIIFIPSNGLHVNGYTLGRKLAETLHKGYDTPVDGTQMTYGEALLQPTRIYVKAVEACIDMGVEIHYAANISGHGWRKIMRAPQPFTYRIQELPKPQPIFDFIRFQGPVDVREAYSTFNMGVGFVLFVAERDAVLAVNVLEHHGYPGSIIGGHLENGDKHVVIEPVHVDGKPLTFRGYELGVR